MKTKKAERMRVKQQHHPPDEHALDLFLNVEDNVHVNLDPTADALAASDKLDGAFIAAPDALGNRPQQRPPLPLPPPTVIPSQPEQQHIRAREPTGVFPPGMVLLKRFLSPAQQQSLVDDARVLGLRAAGGFYKPTYASGAKCRLHQMCLGRHWNVVTEQYESTRSNFDGADVLPLPVHWRELAVQSLAAARAVDPRVMGSCVAMVPDICVVNYYKKAGRNGMHVDKDESAAALAMGSPVVSFSVGAAAEFAFLDHYPVGGEAVPIVRLESGDVLVFGGPARGVVHALTRVYADSQPPWLRMRSGRLNLTFREFEPSGEAPRSSSSVPE